VVICAACCTRLDGVNHCHACLKVLGARQDEPRPRRSVWPLTAALCCGLGYLVLFAVFWLLQGRMAP
jgi:hypothetical protein